ncbi:Immunoglobulin [Cordylochernes scorpioides]|uniref:Immunoglobulin n=1 Tax=Cordylochernes scorpioides TaxID=51811 RepID=A0ABY6LBD8_9ARAC|nr:Immunoglobulin [Cordylochernes scorpioides]
MTTVFCQEVPSSHSEGWYYISLVLMLEVTCAEVEGDMGQPFTLACNQSTDHQAGLWLKEGRALDSGLSWQLQDGVLETSALQPSDSGNYTCLLPEFPPISTRLFVRIPDKRHVAAAPPGRLSEVHIHPSSVVATVRWKLGSDGGCPISHFTLLYCSHNSSWKLPAPPHIGPSTRQFFVYHLQPGTTYQFRLWATNRLGPGESTDVTASTTLPSDPPGIIPFSTCQMECFILTQYLCGIPPCEDDVPAGVRHLLASNSRTLTSLAWLVVVSMVTASVLVLACLSCLLIYRENASSLHLAATGHCVSDIFQSYCLNPDIHAKRYDFKFCI